MTNEEIIRRLECGPIDLSLAEHAAAAIRRVEAESRAMLQSANDYKWAAHAAGIEIGRRNAEDEWKARATAAESRLAGYERWKGDAEKVASVLLAGVGLGKDPDMAKGIIDSVIAALTAAFASGAESEWQDIATAPKDGTAVWLFVGGERYIGYCQPSNWLCDRDRWFVKAGIDHIADDEDRKKHGDRVSLCHAIDVHPTHWQPLPTPPATGGEG